MSQFVRLIDYSIIHFFVQPDPKAGDYTSFNTYCGGDPVKKPQYLDVLDNLEKLKEDGKNDL